MQSSRPDPTSATARAARPVAVALYAILPAFVFAGLILIGGLDGTLAWDMRQAFLPAAADVLHGRTPYDGLNSWAVLHQAAYVYPPFVAFVLAPLTVFSEGAAIVIAMILLLIALYAILWVTGVRDPRVYGFLCLWPCVWDAVQVVTVAIVLALLVALAWRWRDRRPVMPAAALGVAIGAKLFLAPLWLWLVATGRRSAAGWTIVVGLAVVFVPWAALGFVGLGGYPALLRRLTELEQTESFSAISALTTLGVSVDVARAITTLVALLLCAAAFFVARRGRDLQSLTLFLVAALVFSPILWHHYFTVLIVPLAVVRPRLGPVWFLPLLSWPGPYASLVFGEYRCLTLLAMAALAAFLIRETGRWDTSAVSAGLSAAFVPQRPGAEPSC